MCHGPVYMIFWKSVWWQFWFFSLLWSSLQWRSTASPEIIHQCQRTVEIAMNKTKQIKKKQKPTKREMLIDGQKSAYVPWTRSWFLTRIHRAMRMVWFGSRICAKSQRERHSATTKKGKNGKEKEDSGIGNSSKEAVVSSWVHTALCALREQLYECLLLCSSRSMARASCHPTGLLLTFAPIRSSLPSPNTSVRQNPPRGPSVGASHIPYPASLPAMGWAELGRILLTPTKSKTVVSFRAKSCRYLGCNSQFGEVSGKS